MPRRVEDILPNDRRSIREIPLEPKSPRQTETEKRTPASAPHKAREVPIRRLPLTPPPTERIPPPRRKRNSSKLTRFVLITGGAVVVVGIAAYFISGGLSRAVFTIVPRAVPLSASGSYVFYPEEKAGTLSYDVINETAKISVAVKAVDGPRIETKARGTMTVYNSYSKEARRLIAGTRFDRGDGKIYRLASSIMIPGYTKSASGNIVPGRLNAAVIADAAGADYNVTRAEASGDFKVVLYKGTDKYGAIYGRLATDISGGFAGNKKTVQPSVLASTTAAIESRLASDMRAQIRQKLPAGGIMYEDGFILSLSSPEISGSSANEAMVTVRGTAYGIVIDKDEFVAKVLKDMEVDSFDGLPYETPGMNELSFTVSNKKELAPGKSPVIAQINGKFELVGIVPTDELKKKFAGTSLADTETIMRSYSGLIDLAKSSGQVVPPWSKIPTNPDKISIILKK